MTKKVKHILCLAKKIISDHKNSNLFLEILENFQVEDEEVIMSCCSSAGKVLQHFIEATDFIQCQLEQEKDSLSKEEKFHLWLLEEYKNTCNILCGLLQNGSISVQISSVEAFVAIMGGLGNKNTTECVSSSLDIMEKIVAAMLDKEKVKGKLIAQLPTLLSTTTDNGELLMRCLSSLHAIVKQDGKLTDCEAFNIWLIVKQIANGFELDGKAKSLLNKTVLAFLKKKLPVKLYKDILAGIDTVMEKMTSPLLLADFLSQAFNIGGAISLMSLNGLFVLIHKYNLNYPDFYEKLYSLFQPQIFGAKYRARFFHLADLFLSSTHLPSYVVAAFAKRLARLSIHAPATGVQIVLPFIFTLIKRHPACEVLLHKSEGPMEFDSDPYLEEETLKDCKALDSCLWELKTLEHHYCPVVSTKATKRQIKEEPLTNFLENTVTEIIEREAKIRKKDVALTFEKSTDFCLLGKFLL